MKDMVLYLRGKNKLKKVQQSLLYKLLNFSGKVGTTTLLPGPKGKHIFGTTKINDRGQVVIPKKARDLFDIKPDDALIILGDEAEGIAIIKAEQFEKRLNETWNCTKHEIEE